MKRDSYRSFLCGCIILSCVFAMFMVFTAQADAEEIFYDDFNNAAIDTAKWTIRGNTVKQEDGIMKLEQAVTDSGGHLSSQWITINPQKILSIERKVRLHYSNNYYLGAMVVILENSGQQLLFMIQYANYDYNSGIDCPAHGFYIIKQNGDIRFCTVQTNYASSPVSPIWDTWLAEKTEYNPLTGLLEYYINNEKKIEFNVGVLPQLSNYRIHLEFEPYGWYTGHYQYFDDLRVSDYYTGNYTVSGYVRDLANNGISGVTLTFGNNGGTSVSDNSGYYSKTLNAGWSGNATPSKSGYTFTPISKSYTSITSNQLDQNYTAIPDTRIINLTGDLAFGSVTVGSTATKTLTISNTGNSPLAVSSITYPTGFSGNWSGGTIAAGDSQSVTVTFAPTATMIYSGMVTVNSDKTGGTDAIAISGSGIPASPTITSITPSSGSTASVITVTITGTNFIDGATTVTVGGTQAHLVHVTSSTSLTCIIASNTAGAKDVVVTVAGAAAAAMLTNGFTYIQPTSYTVNFTASPTAGGTVAPSASQTVASGGSTSPVTATANSGYTFINWTNQSGSVVSTSATLPAQIIASNMTYTANFQQSPTRIINLNGSLAFGNVNVGTTKQMTFTIGNSGNSTITVSSIAYPTGFAGDWNGGTISASGSKTVTITFTPTAAQNYGGTVTVNSDKTSGTNTLAISGAGVAVTKIIGLSGSLAFGNLTVNTTKQLTFTIGNTGNSALTVSSITYPMGFTGNWSGGTITAGGSQIVTVTFSPTAIHTYSGTVTVNSDKTSGTNTLAISGTGTQAAVSYTISGYVKDANNTGMSGVTLTFGNSAGTTSTDTSGYYSKAFTAAWTGLVTPSKSGYTFTPATRSYSNVTTNQTNQNYTGGVPPAAFRIWIDKNGNGIYDSGEEVVGASVRVNSETTDRGVTDSQGIIAIPSIANDAKIYAQKTLYSMSNPKAVDANFANTRSKNPYYAGSVNGKMYDFVMASDIMAADGTYTDFPGQGKTLLNTAKDSQGNMLIQLVHPKIGWNIVVSFEEAQSAAFYDQIKSGFKSYADYMYNFTDGYFTVKNVILVKGAYLNSAQWNYSDVQVRNSEWPNAHIFGNRYNWQTRISMGKDWGGAAPDGYNWYSTLGHESGHYLLGFYDEYLSGSKKKVSDGTWTYRISHDGDSGESNEFPKNYELMDYQYTAHEMSDPTEYYPHNYSSADIVTNQFYLRQGQSCWTYFKSYYQNDIRTQMAANGLTGFSDAFFNNLIIPPHTTGSYPGSDRTKRNGPAAMNRDTVTFIEWNLPTARSTRQNQNVFDANAVVLDETGTPVSGADVWLVSSDRRSFQGKTDKNGIVKCGSLLIGKHLEAYYDGRKAEVMIDAVKESYVLIFPVNSIALRDNLSTDMLITAKPDSTNPKRLTITASGSSLSSAPSVTLSQSHGYSVGVSMTASGTNQFSGVADCHYDSGILQVSSGPTQSVSPFEIFSTEVGPASGYYAPNAELEMAYSSTTFTGTGSFVIVNSSAPVPPNNGLIQVGNVYSFGFSDTVSSVRNVILNIRLPESGKGANLSLYGWDIQNKVWTPIQGGSSDKKFFSISLASLDYPAYALFSVPQANDPNPPNPVTGFTAWTGTSLWSIGLQWTTPNDADVFAYDIRFNTAPVTEDNWNNCISVGNVPEPAAPGTVQSFSAEMPDPDSAYYFGIKAIDEAGNSSALVTLSSPVKSQAADADGDGMPDFWETSQGLSTNLNDAQNDDDGDGLTNFQEYQHHTDPKHSDTDRDGYSDGDEIAQITDPNDANSHPNYSSSPDINLADAIAALQVVAGLNSPVDTDVNNDGKIGLEEVIYILQKVAGLR